MIDLEACVATQSWVNKEYRRGLSMHPCGSPVLRISEEVFPTFTTWGWPVMKSWIQLHGGVQNQGPELGEYYGVEC